jgi:hypothetical protein
VTVRYEDLPLILAFLELDGLWERWAVDKAEAGYRSVKFKLGSVWLSSKGKRELIHGIVAFGGGILVAAVAFSLALEGMETLTPTVLAITFSLGGVAFCFMDAYLSL